MDCHSVAVLGRHRNNYSNHPFRRGRTEGEVEERRVAVSCARLPLSCKNACFCSSSPSCYPYLITVASPLLSLSLSLTPTMFLISSSPLSPPLSFALSQPLCHTSLASANGSPVILSHTHTRMHAHTHVCSEKEKYKHIKYTVYMKRPHMRSHMFCCLCLHTCAHTNKH